MVNISKVIKPNKNYYEWDVRIGTCLSFRMSIALGYSSSGVQNGVLKDKSCPPSDKIITKKSKAGGNDLKRCQ